MFLKKCYSTPSKLFLVRGTEITSTEGTKQRVPVSMAI